MEFSNTNQRTKRGVNSGRKLPQIELSRFFINSTFRDWFMTVLRKYNDWTQKEIQRTQLAGEEKLEFKTMAIHAHF